MKHLTALVCVGFALLGGNAFAYDFDDSQDRIICQASIIDSGDTFYCMTKNTQWHEVHIEGIQAPQKVSKEGEIDHKKDGPYIASKANLMQLLQDKYVVLTSKHLDHSALKQTVHVVLAEKDGIKDVGEELLKSGYVRNTSSEPAYKKAEDYAKKNKKGLWKYVTK